jgi:hypothetical protein
MLAYEIDILWVPTVYYLSYPHQTFKNWWVVYKVNHKMHTRRYHVYMEGQDDDDVVHVYQEQIK